MICQAAQASEQCQGKGECLGGGCTVQGSQEQAKSGGSILWVGSGCKRICLHVGIA